MGISVVFNRFDMGFSLGIHIILAVIGIAIPLIIMLAEILGQKYNNIYYKTLSKRLFPAFIILFAIGTASGTLVAVNLLFLWPNFMSFIGQVAILPVYLEVFAFFGESIFIAIYIYSRKKVCTYAHAFIMGLVSLFAALSAVFITMLNAFMNTPTGFNIPNYLANGIITNINPYAIFSTPSTLIEVFHVVSTSYLVGTFILIIVFAYKLLKTKKNQNMIMYYKYALRLMLFVAFIAVIFAIISGLLSIPMLYSLQPEKYAALELDIHPISNAPEIIFGTYANGSLSGYLTIIPNLQSILATGSPNGTVPGLSQFPTNTWPPLIVHDFFDFMVLFGFGLGIFFILLIFLKILKVDILINKIVLILSIIAGVVSILLLEIGWLMAEFGRQPWIIYNIMTVSQAANYSSSIMPIAIAIILFYVFIIPATIYIIRKTYKNRDLSKELGE